MEQIAFINDKGEEFSGRMFENMEDINQFYIESCQNAASELKNIIVTDVKQLDHYTPKYVLPTIHQIFQLKAHNQASRNPTTNLPECFSLAVDMVHNALLDDALINGFPILMNSNGGVHPKEAFEYRIIHDEDGIPNENLVLNGNSKSVMIENDFELDRRGDYKDKHGIVNLRKVSDEDLLKYLNICYLNGATEVYIYTTAGDTLQIEEYMKVIGKSKIGKVRFDLVSLPDKSLSHFLEREAKKNKLFLKYKFLGAAL